MSPSLGEAAVPQHSMLDYTYVGGRQGAESDELQFSAPELQ